jgi:8-oxo-dGTP pyrophosphatase MutT (NUDIX family)
MTFEESYVGKLRSLVGSRCLLIPGARLIISRGDGFVLLQHRSDFSVWGLPGGNAEEGEDLTEVITREALEETGLRIKNPKPFGFGGNPEFETVEFPNGDVCQFFVMMFYTTEFDGHIMGDGFETLDLRWFDPNNLPEKMLENMRRSVEAYLAFTKTGSFQMI